MDFNTLYKSQSMKNGYCVYLLSEDPIVWVIIISIFNMVGMQTHSYTPADT